MKITFEITSIPHSLDYEDELHNLLNDDGIMSTIENELAHLIEKIDYMRDIEVKVKVVR